MLFFCCNGADFLSALPGLPPAGRLGRCQGSGRGRREIATLGGFNSEMQSGLFMSIYSRCVLNAFGAR